MEDANTPLANGCGTYFYQSYEKKFMSPIQYTCKSDIYSFGITFCQLLDAEGTLNKSDAAPFHIPQGVIDTSDDELIDFLKQCLNKEYRERWSACMLLEHSFLRDYDAQSITMKAVENLSDLQFMSNSLIDYYSSFAPQSDFDSYTHTPIDNVYSDDERISNIAKSSGCSVQFVEQFIMNNVKNMKRKRMFL